MNLGLWHQSLSKSGTHVQWKMMQLRKKEILTHVTTWMKLEDIMLSEIA